MACLKKRATRRGVSVLEGAFMIPILMSLVFGAIEFGSMLHIRHTMLHAAREAARTVAVEDGTVADAQFVANDLLPSSDSLNFDVAVTAPAIDSLDRDVRVQISIPFAEAALGDFFGIFGSNVLRVEAVMRSEQ